jgi:hypothetical protein
MEIKALTYQDKKTILAAALSIREWNIDDLTDDTVYYSTETTTGSVRGTYKCTYSITNGATGQNVTLGAPSQVVKRTIYEPLVIVGQFSLDQGGAEFSDDGLVIRTGKVFEAGDYPDKGFSITEEELADAAVNFSPVNNDLEHQSTILDGKLGQLTAVEAKGTSLFGTVKIPKWLNDQLGSDPLKVSLAWARNTKQIIKNALVLNPRIEDAQLVAAFTAANSNTGGVKLSDTKKPSLMDRLKAAFSKGSLPDVEEAELDQIKMSDDAKPDTKPDAEPKKEESKESSADFTTVRAENDGLRAAMLATKATEFADKCIADCKAFPAERDLLIAQFKLAAQDDNAGVACFSVTGELNEGERLKLLRDTVSARPTHNLTNEQIAGAAEGGQVIVFAGGTTAAGDADTPTPAGKPISAARRKKLGIEEKGDK